MALFDDYSRGQLKCYGTRAETKFRLSAKRTSPFKSAGASVQSTAGSRGVRISGSNAGYTMFRGSVKGTGYPLHSSVSPSLPLPCVSVCHHISTTGLYLPEHLFLVYFINIYMFREYLGPSSGGRCQLKCDGTRAETRFRLSAKRTSPFKSEGTSVQSTTGSRGVRISGSNGSNAGYTMLRGSVKGTGYPLHSPASPSLPLPCVTVCHHVSTRLYLFHNMQVWCTPCLPAGFEHWPPHRSHFK